MTYTCVCGACFEGPKTNTNLAEICKVTGLVFAFNVRSGMTTTWLCPACWGKCKPALETLIEIFGDQITYIHFLSLFDKILKERVSETQDQASEDP